jgi:hypothetical protein
MHYCSTGVAGFGIFVTRANTGMLIDDNDKNTDVDDDDGDDEHVFMEIKFT